MLYGLNRSKRVKLQLVLIATRRFQQFTFEVREIWHWHANAGRHAEMLPWWTTQFCKLKGRNLAERTGYNYSNVFRFLIPGFVNNWRVTFSVIWFCEFKIIELIQYIQLNWMQNGYKIIKQFIFKRNPRNNFLFGFSISTCRQIVRGSGWRWPISDMPCVLNC